MRPGDCVRIVSPASWPDAGVIEDLTAVLESWGLVVEVGRHALDRRGFTAGEDADRLADLVEALRDPGVRGVFASRGGAGAYRIAGDLGTSAYSGEPTPLVGFSDITHLLMEGWRVARAPGVHGFLLGPRSVASARSLLLDGEPVVVERDPSAYSARVEVAGIASGTLLGGNLSALAHMAGAGLPDLTGAILLLEDVRGMGLGRVDRQLVQLRRAGALDGLAGVALGLFTGFDGYVDREWTLVDVLADHLQPLGVPVLGGLPIGHGGVGPDGGPDQVCVAIGTRAVLDVAAGTLVSDPVETR